MCVWGGVGVCVWVGGGGGGVCCVCVCRCVCVCVVAFFGVCVCVCVYFGATGTESQTIVQSLNIAHRAVTVRPCRLIRSLGVRSVVTTVIT